MRYARFRYGTDSVQVNGTPLTVSLRLYGAPGPTLLGTPPMVPKQLNEWQSMLELSNGSVVIVSVYESPTRLAPAGPNSPALSNPEPAVVGASMMPVTVTVRSCA